MDLSIYDVSTLLMTDKKEVERLVKKKIIPSENIQNKIRFNKQAVIEWALLNNKPINLSDTSHFNEFQFETISPLLDEDSFYYNCTLTKENYIREIVSQLKLSESIDRNIIVELLVNREKLMSTAIGNGIALPHPRIPIVLGFGKPLINFFFLTEPLELNSIDNKPVHTIILIVSQTVKQHLYILAHLSYLLSMAEFRSALENQKSFDEISRLIEGLNKQRNIQPASL
ncbi:MAG: PTS sugar transporter subunit IIA [Bacteroidota bacterium]|nr:PTS sugar transporter subunit IIA [Bacteroidota bacterium]MDP4189987.1 PTS sugar transporter subunit IIA [Bacteroidota bacterium]MDP4193419.1 PTS sugar transporter subunit IIA [Bacteroidota bacterium]